jgi:hypothetical protein
VAIRVGVRMSVCETRRLSDVGVMSFSRLFFVLLILSVFAVPLFVPAVFGVDGEDVAASAVDRAEAEVASAYEAVLDAEEAGADVSGLLDRLNVAGGYLAEAHVWFGLGDFDEAVRLADLCYGVVVDVSGEAFGLESEAHALGVTDSVVRMTGSMVGVVVVVFLGFVVWRVFKRRYSRRVLEMRPEVVSGGS